MWALARRDIPGYRHLWGRDRDTFLYCCHCSQGRRRYACAPARECRHVGGWMGMREHERCNKNESTAMSIAHLMYLHVIGTPFTGDSFQLYQTQNLNSVKLTKLRCYCGCNVIPRTAAGRASFQRKAAPWEPTAMYFTTRHDVVGSSNNVTALRKTFIVASPSILWLSMHGHTGVPESSSLAGPMDTQDCIRANEQSHQWVKGALRNTKLVPPAQTRTVEELALGAFRGSTKIRPWKGSRGMQLTHWSHTTCMFVRLKLDSASLKKSCTSLPWAFMRAMVTEPIGRKWQFFDKY